MRAFISINLSSEIKETIGKLISSLSKIKPNERFIKADNLHITLKFLGETQIQKIEDIYLSISNQLKGYGGFQCSIKGMGGFPNIKSPKIVWIGVEKNREIEQLFNQIEMVCESFGFAKETRVFSPHITIVRLRDSVDDNFKSQILKNSETSWGTMDVGSVEIMKSTLTPQGAEYEIFKKINLY